MPRGPSPGWTRRKEPILDDHLHASIAQANGVHDENGHYAEILYTGCATRDRAKEIRQALFRSASYINRKGILPKQISVSANVEKAADGTWTVRYQAHDKTHAMAYMIEHYGPDASKFPYRPQGGFPNSSKAAE
jgi:hypothetical protein